MSAVVGGSHAWDNYMPRVSCLRGGSWGWLSCAQRQLLSQPFEQLCRESIPETWDQGCLFVAQRALSRVMDLRVLRYCLWLDSIKSPLITGHRKRMRRPISFRFMEKQHHRCLLTCSGLSFLLAGDLFTLIQLLLQIGVRGLLASSNGDVAHINQPSC